MRRKYGGRTFIEAKSLDRYRAEIDEPWGAGGEGFGEAEGEMVSWGMVFVGTLGRREQKLVYFGILRPDFVKNI